MKCDEFRILVPELLCGELDEGASTQALSHADSCRECARLLAAARVGASALGQLEEIQAPSCLPAVSLAIRRRPVLAMLPWDNPVFARAAAAAMMLLAAVAVVSIVRPPVSRTEREYARRLAHLEAVSEELAAQIERDRRAYQAAVYQMAAAMQRRIDSYEGALMALWETPGEPRPLPVNTLGAGEEAR